MTYLEFEQGRNFNNFSGLTFCCIEIVHNIEY